MILRGKNEKVKNLKFHRKSQMLKAKKKSVNTSHNFKNPKSEFRKDLYSYICIIENS